MKNASKMGKILLILCNVLLIITVVFASIKYSQYVRRNQEENLKEEFIATIESMKLVSQNYLNSERGYVKNWAAYISEHNMTLQEAMDFLRSINTDTERFAHIIDMDTYEAYSAFYPPEEEKIDTYVKYKENDISESDKMFSMALQNEFNGTQADFSVIGKYQIKDNLATAVGVGSRISLETENGVKDYLLLRIIPTEALKKTWVFPVEYSSAEVGIITRAGDYVIKSSSMKSVAFPDYIRGYNFQDDYNKGEQIKDELIKNDRGILSYKNFKGDNCIWYYSSFGDDSPLDILGVVNTSELSASNEVWYVVFFICITLALLAVIDGCYLYNINRRLRETAIMANEASKAKTQFLSAMSHDIRTPMNAVLGMMSIAKSNITDTSYVSDCLEKAMRSGRQLLTLINDVLDISKIESGNLVLNKDEINLHDIIAELKEMAEPLIQEKNLKVSWNCDRIKYPYIYADQLRLNQIYVNLLTNAIKYTESGGSIELHIYEENSLQEDKSTCLVFIISDTGIGMTEEFQKTMYNSFSRAVNTQVNSIQGTGLGLSIVKQIVDMMNGTIECKSALGAGSTFTVRLTLPVIEKTSDIIEEDSDKNMSLDRLNLLVAEDNDINWEIAKVMLEGYGITCDRAENGKHCVDIISESEAGTYDGILMDIQMPVMNGREATRAIRTLPDKKKNSIPIVAMTADAFAEDIQQCIECGMNDHIAKPIDVSKLIACLRKIKTGNL